MKHFYLFLFLISGAGSALGQIQILGRIQDRTTNEPVIAASVAVLNTTTGTVSNEEGDFQLVANNNSTVAIYCLGYKKITIPASEFGTAKKTIYLDPEDQKIEEIIVSNMPIEKLIEKLIKTSTARFNRPIVLNTYYREFVKQNGKYTKFSDGLLDYHVKGSSSKFKSDLIVKESRAARIAKDDNFDPNSLLDVQEQINRNYNFNLLNHTLLKSKNYKNYILTMSSTKDAAGTELHILKIQPREDVSKVLQTGRVVFNPKTNLIYEVELETADSHMKYMKPFKILGYHVGYGKMKLKSSYRMQGDDYVAFYNSMSVGMTVSHKGRNLAEDIESSYDLIVNNYSKGDGGYDKSQIYRFRNLYARGNNYSFKFWLNSNAMVLTSEEQNIIRNLEAASADSAQQ